MRVPSSRLQPALRLRPVSIVSALLCLGSATAIGANDTTERQLGTVTVTAADGGAAPSERTGLYTSARSRGATGLDLTLRETPQTVSVMTRQHLDDFGLTSVNDALAASAGIVIERVETDRTYYTARGFAVTHFQMDGVGVPFIYGNVSGDLDTVIYDRIESIYGANGLITATGQPSATLNFVRKRPGPDLAARVGFTASAWDRRRFEADVTVPLTATGTVRARVVTALEDSDSYLDRYGQRKQVLYGVLEADLGPNTLLALGASHQRNDTHAPLWGALPLVYTDGSHTDFDVSTSTAADWAYWDSQTDTVFSELTHDFANGWTAKAVLTHTRLDSNGALFYVYGTPDKATGLGLYAYPSRYQANNIQNLADVQLSGGFDLGGRRHDLTLGASWSRAELEDRSDYGQGIGTALPPLAGWDGSYPMPAFNASTNGSDFTHTQRSLYAATRLNVSDALKLIVGARSTLARSDGMSYSIGRHAKADAVSPYLGAVYDLDAHWSVYASHTEIFTPQHEVDRNGDFLDPVEGRSQEIGLKAAFLGGKLNGSLALFQTQQNNLAEAAGTVGPTTYYRGVDAQSRGVQLDLAGQITQRLQASVGFTQLSLEGEDGKDILRYTPRRLLRASATYRVPQLDALTLGATLRWQDDVSTTVGNVRVTQAAYALLDLMARYEINRHLSVTAKLNNATDEKYLTSLYWAQSYYGAPRHLSLTANWTY